MFCIIPAIPVRLLYLAEYGMGLEVQVACTIMYSIISYRYAFFYLTACGMGGQGKGVGSLVRNCVMPLVEGAGVGLLV